MAETQRAGADGGAAAASRALVRDVVDETREEAAAVAATDEALLAEEVRRLLKTRALAAMLVAFSPQTRPPISCESKRCKLRREPR